MNLSGYVMVPALLLGIGPNFATVNDTLFNIFRLSYTMQINLVVRGEAYFADSVPLVLANTAVLLVLFFVMHSRVGLDGEKAS